MKLKNKKTGEMGIVSHFDNQSIVIYPIDENWNAKGYKKYVYASLAELNEEWEDYEEPKEYWYIDYGGRIKAINDANDEEDVARKTIGNYFDIREEAEKAVEKLKAFANLRKRGLKFNGWDEADRGMVGEFAIYCDALELDGIERELEIVFGREEL